MKVLITGANGFVGKNLIYNLALNREIEILKYDKDNTLEELKLFTKECNFIFHLAGVNRPKNPEEFVTGNFGLTETILEYLKENNNKCPILISSSIQALLENDYGKSKKMAEDALIEFCKKQGNPVYIYRLPNLFGKWCRPNYNSVIATWCYNISHNIEITVSDRNKELELAYIDDVVKEFIQSLDKITTNEIYYNIPVTYKKTLGEISDLIFKFKNSTSNLQLPEVDDLFEKKLYSTYLTYLDTDKFDIPVKMNLNNRGSFTELLKFNQGQVSVNVCKPGITKGNHWHNTKVEKFIVVRGEGLFKFRKVGTDEVIEYKLNSDVMKILDIPPGYTHNFTNIGTDDLIVIIWCNEFFDKDNPDTFFEEV